MKPGFSKSLYIRGLQCPKSLWFHKHQPELKDTIDAQQQAIFTTGNRVGELACERFPGGVLIPFEGLTVPQQIEQTRKAIAEGVNTIYEASFEYDGIFIKVDILHKGPNGWKVYEVKASTSADKTVYLNDVSLQLYVLQNAGIDIESVYLMHIDSGYVRSGEIELNRLFKAKDLTAIATGNLQRVESDISAFRTMLKQGCPDIQIGGQCSSPYDCDFSGYCWKDVPKDSVFELSGKGIDKFATYHSGVKTLDQLDLNTLNRAQRQQVEQHLKQGTIVNKKEIDAFLKTLHYPLVHFDFETFQSAIPKFDQSRPYQQIPFQFSIHIQHEPGGEAEHHEFLADQVNDPRPALIEKMLKTIPKDACLLAYNKAFECGRMEEMANDFPQYAEALNHLIARTKDLLVPFRSRHLYSWKQKGSASIKKVLPAFCAELTYAGMGISDGGMAMEAYHIMCEEKDPLRQERVRNDLLEYCKLDTWAMVKIFEYISTMNTQVSAK